MRTPCGSQEDRSAPDGRAVAFHLGYRRWVDGLRGLAVLLVLGFHCQLIPGGSFGVDVFFVLSGFLITSLLVEEWQRRGSISLPRFYLRRCLRLLPAFFSLLLISYLYTRFFRPADEVATFRKEMIVAACYVANWPSLHRTFMPTLGHTWSLSVEEQFYVLWPALLYGMLRLRLAPRTILVVVGAGIVASAVLRAALFGVRLTPGPEAQMTVLRLYTGLDTRADTLLVGCLVGLLATWGLLPTSPRSRAVLGVAALASAAGLGYVCVHSRFWYPQFFHGMFTVVAAMIAVILVRLLCAPSRLASWVLESAPLVGVGRISYALYLFHIPILHWLRPARLGWSAPADTLLVIGLSFGAAVISYYAVERPCLRLKPRLQAPGRPTRGLSHAAAAGEVRPVPSAKRRAAA